MLKKNDPLANIVKGIMTETSLRKQIEEKLHNELGIQSRKQLPHELQGRYDELLSEAQKKGLLKEDSEKKNSELKEAPEKLVLLKKNASDKEGTGIPHRILHIHNTPPRDVTTGKHDESKIGWMNIIPVPHKIHQWPLTVSPYDKRLEPHPSHPEVLTFARSLADSKKSLKEENKKDKEEKDYTEVSDAKVDHKKKSDKDYHKDINEGKESKKVRREKLKKMLNIALDNRQKELGAVTQADITGRNSLLDKDSRYKTLHNRYMKVAWPIKEEQTQSPVPSLRKPMQPMQAPSVAPSRPSPVVPVQSTQPVATASPQVAVAPKPPAWVKTKIDVEDKKSSNKPKKG